MKFAVQGSVRFTSVVSRVSSVLGKGASSDFIFVRSELCTTLLSLIMLTPGFGFITQKRYGIALSVNLSVFKSHGQFAIGGPL